MNEETLPLSQPPKSDFERIQRHADSLAKEKKAHLRRISQMQAQVKELQERILYLETLDHCSSTALSDIFAALENKTNQYYSSTKTAFDELFSRTQELSDTIVIHAKEKAADILKKANEQVRELQVDEEADTFSNLLQEEEEIKKKKPKKEKKKKDKKNKKKKNEKPKKKIVKPKKEKKKKDKQKTKRKKA